MIKLKTKELHFDEELKKKIEFICDFCNTRGLKLMNYFFKFLIPQLMEYFQNDKEILLEFIPKVIEENYKNELEIEINKNCQNKA